MGKRRKEEDDVCYACDGECNCYDGTIDERSRAQVLIFLSFADFPDSLFAGGTFVKEISRYHQLRLDEDFRDELIEEKSTEDNVFFIASKFILEHFIEEVDPLYKPLIPDFPSYKKFLDLGGELKKGDFIFNIVKNLNGEWKMSGGEFSPPENFH
jgi:hypothetical protein